MSDDQHIPGLTLPCCGNMKWALSCGYIRKGWLWRIQSPPRWISWSFYIKGKGYFDVSPIHFCPFCGRDLDSPEE